MKTIPNAPDVLYLYLY